MPRVTYGVASSSFHSIRSLSECGNFETTPEEVKNALQCDFYVDDSLTGASSESKAKELHICLISTLKQADLRNGTRSDPEFVLSLPPEYREANESFKFLDEEYTITTLGILWNPSSDKFCSTISTNSNSLKTESINRTPNAE